MEEVEEDSEDLLVEDSVEEEEDPVEDSEAVVVLVEDSEVVEAVEAPVAAAEDLAELVEPVAALKLSSSLTDTRVFTLQEVRRICW